MQHTIKISASCGQVIPLFSAADAMARSYATAGNTPLHKPAYKGKLAAILRRLVADARAGRLPVRDQDGALGSVEEVVQRARKDGVYSEVHQLGADEDANMTLALCLHVALAQLNEWGRDCGDTFKIDTNGVDWIDERGVVSPFVQLEATREALRSSDFAPLSVVMSLWDRLLPIALDEILEKDDPPFLMMNQLGRLVPAEDAMRQLARIYMNKCCDEPEARYAGYRSPTDTNVANDIGWRLSSLTESKLFLAALPSWALAVFQDDESGTSEAEPTDNIVVINGNDAVPLRLLPFASRWLTPLTIARSLAHTNDDDGLQLTGFRLSNGKPLEQLPREWDDLVEQLEALEEKLRHEESYDGENRTRWSKESLQLLPDGAFVWRDAIVLAHEETFKDQTSDDDGVGAISFIENRPGDNTLKLDCFLAPEDRALVAEGFGRRLKRDEPLSHQELVQVEDAQGTPTRLNEVPPAKNERPAPGAISAPPVEGVTRETIIEKFRLSSEWDERLRRAPTGNRYEYLKGTWTRKGKQGSFPALFSPAKVAKALIGRNKGKASTGKFNRIAMEAVISNQFPDWIDEWHALLGESDIE